jgi:hypothetical protein
MSVALQKRERWQPKTPSQIEHRKAKQREYNKRFANKHGIEYFHKYRSAPYTFSASCLKCQREFMSDSSKRGQTMSTIKRHTDYCFNKEAIELKKKEHRKQYYQEHHVPSIEEWHPCPKCGVLLRSCNYQSHVSICDGVADANGASRQARRLREKSRIEREALREAREAEKEARKLAKQQEREFNRQQWLNSRPVVECEKCGGHFLLLHYHRHLEKCDGIYYTNKYERAKGRIVDKEIAKERVKISRTKKREERKNFVNTYKEEHGCYVCGERCHHVIDLHHLNPKEKDDTLSDLVERASMERVKKELDKCVCLCRVCHQKITVNILELLPWTWLEW